MTDTAELKPVASVAEYIARCRELSDGGKLSWWSGLADALSSLVRERDEARELVTEANNSLYGSQGYFHSLNGEPFDKYHLATGIEKLKSEANRQYHALEAAEARASAAEAKRDEALGVLAGVDALGKKILATSEADNVRLRAAITTLHVHMMDISSFTPTVSSSVPLMDQIVRHARATIVEMVKVARKALGGKDE